jgi:hypothetical protein
MKKLFLVVLLILFGFATVQAATFTTNPFPPDKPQEPTRGVPGPNTITQSLDTATVTNGNSVSCNAGSLHTDNSYIRRFDLDGDHNIQRSFDINNVTIGVEVASSAGAAGQPLVVNLYTIAAGDALLFANLTPIGQAVFPAFADTSLAIVDLPVTGTVNDPASQDLVVEIFLPNGQSAGHSFFIGSNANGEIAPTYLAAADCGAPEPATTASIGFPNMHLLMLVDGVESAAAPIPTMSEWGMILLGLILSVSAITILRRKRNTAGM